MHEISPVLAGTYDAANYAPAASNINASTIRAADTSSANATSAVDDRRYTKFDRTASQTADADMSFGDFLDMVNPLQHIPVVSSVYRAVTNENINPVSRVAGDILYGGAMGAMSAVVSGVGAISDAVLQARTGHDTAGTVLASIFGSDDKSDAAPATTALAQADTKTPSAIVPTNIAPVAVASQTLPPLAPPAATAVTPTDPTSASAATAVALNAAPADAAPMMQAKAFPLNRQAFGGVMAPVNNIEDQNRIIALSQGSHAMRLGHTIYTNPMMNGAHPLPVATPAPAPDATATASAGTSPPSTAAATTTAQAAPAATATTSAQNTGHNPLPQNLIDDMIMMKAIGQYKGVANSSSPATGSTLDLQN